MSSSSSPKLSQAALREFLLETQESLEQVEVALVELERNPRLADASAAGVGRMFRLLHSVKGSCGFLGYPKLEELAHVGESLLNRIRERILPVDKTVISALLSVVDAIREVVDHIEAENNEGHRDYSDLTQHLSQILDSEDLPESNAADPQFTRSGHDSAVEPARDKMSSMIPTRPMGIPQ
jgi:two-component system chemotaxis sensor kinase CheA